MRNANGGTDIRTFTMVTLIRNFEPKKTIWKKTFFPILPVAHFPMGLTPMSIRLRQWIRLEYIRHP